MLIRSDPFRDIDRWMDEFRFGARERIMPMDAYGYRSQRLPASVKFSTERPGQELQPQAAELASVG
jgi:hypothetical protein